jgi:dihydrofolate reductase
MARETAVPLVAVVAVARNGIIGGENRLLWRLRNDLRRFKALTIGKPLIMGRKTFLSIGKPLPGRHNIIVTRDPDFTADGVEIVHSLAEALSAGQRAAKTSGADEVIIGGGSEIYRALLPACSRAHVTLVDCAPEGDAVFPWPMPFPWRETARETHEADAENEHKYAFITFIHDV